MYFDDKDLKQIINQYPDVPKQKPLFRKILFEYGNTQDYENVLTYIMYETSGTPKKIDNAVIINVRPEWILDNISDIDALENKSDKIFVMDGKGIFLRNSGGNNELEKSLSAEFGRHKSMKDSMPGSFICMLMGREYVVTYDNISNIGFILFKIQPVKEVYKYVDMLKINILIVAVIALLLSILISLAVSKKLYKPLGKLVNQISTGKNKEFDFEQYDEISYLNNVYKYSMGKLAQYYDEKVKNQNIIKAYWLKKLLIEAEKINKEQYETICNEISINLPYDFNYIVCVLKIDSFKEFQRSNDLRNRDLIRFAIINIMTETLSQDFAVEGVDVNEEKIALLVGIKPDQENYTDLMIESVKSGQDYIEQYFSISVTASIGEKVDSFWRISESYENASENSLYRFILGKKSIIIKKEIEQNYLNPDAAYSTNSETKLVDSIRSRDIQEMEENLCVVINEISLLKYDYMMVMIIHLADVVKNTVNSAFEYENSSSRFSFIDLKYMVNDIETIDEFHQILLNSLRNMIKTPSNNEIDVKYRIIAETAVDIINKNYWDKSLYSNQIASMMKMNPRRLAKVFKDVMGVSMPDYINNARLGKAAELLENTRMNVYDIIDRIGFDNESYFYRMFKAKFGYTPKDYALFKNVGKTK